MKKLIILTSALAMLGACEKDNMELGSAVEGAVSFSSASISRATDEMWTADDEIGVFAYKGGVAYNNYENIAYETTAGGQEAAFTPSGGTTIFYPTNGDKLTFKAYSPYQAAASSGVYAIDVSEQSNPALIDLIVADDGLEYDKSSAEASLTFYHKLTKLTMTLEPGVGLEASDLVGATVELRGVTTEGAYSLNDNSFTYEPATSNITARTISDGVSYDAILLPSSDATFDVVFTLTNGKSYTWKVENKTFTSGINQSYTITVEESEITVSSATLSGWGLNSSEELTAEELIPIVSTTIVRPYSDRVYDGTIDNAGDTFAVASKNIQTIGDEADFAIEANYDSSNKRTITISTNYKTEFNDVYPAYSYSSWQIETVSGEPTDTYVASFTQGSGNNESTAILSIGTVRGQIKLKVTTSHFDTSIYPDCATVTDEVLITITDIYPNKVLVTEVANGVYEATPIPYYADVKKIHWEAELSYDDSTTESLSQAATGTDSDLTFSIKSVKNGSAKIVAIAENIYSLGNEETKSETLNTTFTTEFENSWDGTTVATSFESGTGTDTDPYIIASGAQLAFLAQQVNSGTSYSGEYFQLANDIYLNNHAWTPIGNYAAEFSGSFDGDGKSIKGIYINTTERFQGLFGYISEETPIYVGAETGEESIIKNITVDGTISGGDYTGALVGSSYSADIINCHNEGSVNGGSRTGGLAGYSCSCVITSCSNIGSVVGGMFVAGVIGDLSIATITDCYNTGDVSGNYTAGGVVGMSSSSVSNCYNTGNVSGNYTAGGVVGVSALFSEDYSVGVSNCYNSGNIDGDEFLGGVVGASEDSSISNCYNSGNIDGDKFLGGVVGMSEDSSISNCYNSGNIDGDEFLGGVVCKFTDSKFSNNVPSCFISNCYNIGSLSGNIGVYGIVADVKSYYCISNCYWLESTADYGGNYEVANDTSRKTVAEMQATSFVNLLNASGTSWMSDYTTPINKGYPILTWQ